MTPDVQRDTLSQRADDAQHGPCFQSSIAGLASLAAHLEHRAG